jgi:thiol-disulfide isomerase/thioredoxin
MKYLSAVLVPMLVFVACKTPANTGQDQAEQAEPLEQTVRTPRKPAHAVGETSRDWIVEHHPTWAADRATAPDDAAARSLAQVDPGAEIEVYLGTWCPDSRREVPRFWRALDIAGDVPFEVRYVGLDRDFQAGDVDLESRDVIAVPTFVVLRDGKEVGRVVETAVDGIEADIGALLSGDATGTISATRK